MAHKRQLKTLPVSRRKATKALVFQGENSNRRRDHGVTPHQSSIDRLVDQETAPQQSSTLECANNSIRTGGRKHSEVEEVLSDSSSDFYGFVAESFIFTEEGKKTGKRKHSDSEGDLSGSSSDFYGFAADSSICTSEENCIPSTSKGQNTKNVRRSKRKLKKIKKDDFVYY